MPIYEYSCQNEICEVGGQTFERFVSRFDTPDPECCFCGRKTERQPSRFAMPFSGEISARYLDKSLEGGHNKSGAHWAWKKNTISGKAEPVYIDSFQKQREYAKSEGLALPSDTTPGFISSDGRTLNRATDKEVKEFIQHSNVESAKIAAEQT
jgi:predicted nucleic acid-binding Zn ribbon protein